VLTESAAIHVFTIFTRAGEESMVGPSMVFDCFRKTINKKNAKNLYFEIKFFISQNYILLINNNWSTVLDFSVHRRSEIICPALLKVFSEAQEDAGTHRYSLARALKA